MTQYVPLLDTHAEAILFVLQSTAIAARRGEKPRSGGWQGAPGQSPFKPYLILHYMGGDLTGTVSNPNDDLTSLWQVTAVGGTAEQCTEADDLARAALLAVDAVEVVNRAVDRMQVEALSEIRPDRTVSPQVWISTPVYRLDTSPNPGFTPAS